MDQGRGTEYTQISFLSFGKHRVCVDVIHVEAEASLVYTTRGSLLGLERC